MRVKWIPAILIVLSFPSVVFGQCDFLSLTRSGLTVTGKPLWILVEATPGKDMSAHFNRAYNGQTLDALAADMGTRLKKEMEASGLFPQVELGSGEPGAGVQLNARFTRVSSHGLLVELYQFVPIPPLLPANGASLILEGEIKWDGSGNDLLRWGCAAESFGTWFHTDKHLMRHNLQKVVDRLMEIVKGLAKSSSPPSIATPIMANRSPVLPAWLGVPPDEWKKWNRAQIPARVGCSASSRPDPYGTVLAFASFGQNSGQREFVVRLVYFKRGPAVWSPGGIQTSAQLRFREKQEGFAPLRIQTGSLPPAWPLAGRRRHGGIILGHEHDVLWGVNSLELVFPLPEASSRYRTLRPDQLFVEVDGRQSLIQFDPTRCLIALPRK